MSLVKTIFSGFFLAAVFVVICLSVSSDNYNKALNRAELEKELVEYFK